MYRGKKSAYTAVSWLSAVAATAEHGYDSAQRFAERDRQPLDARAERARLVYHTSKGADDTLVFDMPAAMMDPKLTAARQRS